MANTFYAVFALIIVLYFCRGFFHGILLSLTSVLGTIIALSCATFFCSKIFLTVAGFLDVGKSIALAISWFTIFLILSIISFLVNSKILRSIRYKEDNTENFRLPIFNRLLGGFFACFNAVIMICVSFFFYQLIAVTVARGNLEPFQKNTVTPILCSINKNTLFIFNRNPDRAHAEAVAEFLSNPVTFIKTLKEISLNAHFKEILLNSDFLKAIIAQNKQQIINNLVFQKMIASESLALQLEKTGLFKNSEINNKENAEELANYFVELGGICNKKANIEKIHNLTKKMADSGILEAGSLPYFTEEKDFFKLLDLLLF